MEYHYSELCMPTDQLLSDPYNPEYAAPYIVPSADAEYKVRSTVLVDGGDRFGVSAVVIDKHEELIWMGNQGGHVTSYYGPGMQKYTSFQIHESEEVRDIVTAEEGIYALTKTTLRHQIRRGLPRHTFKSEHMTDMQCLYQAGSKKLLMGGHQNKLIELDLEKMKAIAIPIVEEGCVILRSGGGSLVTCGSAGGVVTLRDLRCLEKSEQTFRAHSACLSDLDMQGNILITCGFTLSDGGVAVAEPDVNVWDVRCLRTGKQGAAWTATTSSPPLLLHFLPVVSGRAVAVSGDGHVALLHVNKPQSESHSVFQVDTQSSACTVMDVSSTSQALVFGDQSGHLNLFSPQQNNEPVFNNFSKKTKFADKVTDIPRVSFSDTSFRPSSVLLPPLASGSKWFNQLPEQFFKKVYRRPKPIDQAILDSMKMQGPIGYAPNPKTTRRNQFPYLEESLDDLVTPKQVEIKPQLQPVPKNYSKVDVRYTKYNSNEDVENHNNTGYPGLEATLANSYCNAMLQVLYYMRPVKKALVAHACAKEFCLSCEIGFLFRMMDTSGGAPCQASSFLRAFRTLPEAAALGLILPERASERRVDYIELIQSWNRFILHQLHFDILEKQKKDGELVLRAKKATSPPKGASRLGNAPINIAKLNTRLQPAPGVNGHFGSEFKFTELEYLTPAAEVETQDGDYNREANDNCGRNNMIVKQGRSNHLHNVNVMNNKNVDKEDTDISKLFAIGRQQLNKCLKCNKEEERESLVLACALQYPPPNKENGHRETKGGFLELLQSSLSSRRSTPAWCEQCRRFSPTMQRGRIIRLPPILAINCGGVTAQEKAYWAKAVHKEVGDSAKRGGSSKPCRYGLHCARPGCRFKHPDRPGSSQNCVTSTCPTRESQCVLPYHLFIRLQADGDIYINDKTDQCIENIKENRTIQAEEEYTLSAAVYCIEDTPKNLVAFIRMTNESDPQWYLFNDLSIVPVSVEEVVQFSAWWKTPCVLFYTERRRTPPPEIIPPYTQLNGQSS